MPIPNDLLVQIEAALGNSITSSLTSASDTSDIFEAYIFSLAVEAARTEGAEVYFRNVDGNSTTIFTFRTSPGYLYSTTRPYTHAVCVFPNKPPLEIHIGVRVAGRSKVLHECDVAVVSQVEAETCRRSRQAHPRSSKVRMAVECKFYSTPLPLHLARSFIGLVSDLSGKDIFFTTNNSSESIEKLLTEQEKHWEHNLIPSAPIKVSRLRNDFQGVFKKYKAR